MFTDNTGKRWYKGNLHTHTTVSDGKRTPDEVIRLYRENGYDFLALTDHWIPSAGKMTEDGMLLLSGCEYNINGGDVLRGVFHVVSIGEKTKAKLERGDDTLRAADLVREIRAAGGIAILAHPAWSLETCEQIMVEGDFDGVEIYNSVSGLPRNCRPYSGEVIDQLAVRGRVFPCMAADDTHFYENETCLSYIYVQADALTEDAVMDALRAGRVMATQGPRFFVTVSDNADGTKRVHLDCDPVETVIFYTGSVWHSGRSLHSDAGKLTEADFTFKENDRFVRIEIVDRDGKHGFATPVLW